MEFLIKTNSIGGLTEEQFFHFCQENQQLRFEKTSSGEILLMAPTGSETGAFNIAIGAKLFVWADRTKLGICFDSNTGFTLPNNAVRSPDAAYIKKEEWSKVAKSDRQRFAHICPDFVIELLSYSDEESVLKVKMDEWMHNGCSLAWLVNPIKKETIIYRKKKQYEIVSFDQELSGEDVLPGFTLNLNSVFLTEY
jgi:Uma2 family endonuclease